MFIELKLLNGEELEQEVDSNVCVIGRSSKCNIVVPHEGMSRTHCQIEVIGGDYFVTDLGSTNGVLIDGKKIEPNRKIPYQTYLTLSFGAVQSLQIREELAPSMAAPIIPTRSNRDASGPANNTMTKTKVIGQSPKSLKSKSPPKRADKKAETNEKIRTWAVNIVALLMVLAAAAWYLQDGASEAEYSYEEPTKTAAPQKKFDQF